jgi:phosphatidylglycerophosphate synthase
MIDMSWLYEFKPQKDRALRSVSHLLMAVGVTPNMITATGLLVSIIAGLFAMSGHLYMGIVIFLFGAGLDAVDGSFARACGLTSEFGRYLDSICDRLSELAFITGAVLGGVSFFAFIVIAGSTLLLGSRIYNHSRGLSSNAAMFSRPERLTLLIVGLLVPYPYNIVIFILAGFLSIVSSAQVLTSSIHTRKGLEWVKSLLG